MTGGNKKYITLDGNGLATMEGYFTVYNYSCSTREYTGTTDEYLMSGVGIPACSMAVSPPEIPEKHVALAQDGAWRLAPDYRGQTAYAKDGSGSMTISTPGELADDYTFDVPATAFDLWTEDGWITDSDKISAAQIAEAESTQSALLNTATQSIVVWQTKLLRGRQLTEAEASALDLWLDYIDQLEALNTSLAPNISWPEVPKT